MTLRKILVYSLCISLIISSFTILSIAGNANSNGWGVASWYCEKNQSLSDDSKSYIISNLIKTYNKKWNTISEDEWNDEQYEEFINASNEAIDKAESNNNKYNITVAFSMPEDVSYFYDYVSKCNPYVYITKDGKPYSKTLLMLGSYNEKYATACLSIEGYGEYEGMICHNNEDGIPTAQSQNYGTLSTISISVYESGFKCKYTNKMSQEMAVEINNYNCNYSSPVYFKDVSKDTWYYDSITFSSTNGIIKGNGSYFYPMENLTYAEAITMASRLNANYNGLDISTVFNTSCNPWYETYVDYAKENNIPCDYDNMNIKITRAEFLHIFYSALPSSEYRIINDIENDSIPDVPMSHKYSKEIYRFYKAGILSGNDSQKSFNPDSNIKRCEVATILCRMMGQGRIKY